MKVSVLHTGRRRYDYFVDLHRLIVYHVIDQLISTVKPVI